MITPRVSKKRPAVSICMSTFQHEAYIEDAIKSVLMQESEFTYELVIGEDMSSDRTRQICERYALRHPERIKLLASDRKYGQNENLYRILMACEGKYIALCEGDDCWTDHQKLQKQVHFLENHPEFVMCFHRINSIDEHNDTVEENNDADKVIYYEGNDFFHIFVPTLAIMFRNCLDKFPREFFMIKSTDAFIAGMLSGFGKGADLGFVAGNYRRHGGGCYNSLARWKKYRQSVHTRQLMKRSSFFDGSQRMEIKKELSKRTVLYSKILLKRLELFNFARFIFFSFILS